jgi:hypothetical protein
VRVSREVAPDDGTERRDLVLRRVGELPARLTEAARIEVLGGAAGGVWRVVRARRRNGKLFLTVSSFADTPRGEGLAASGSDARRHHHGRQQPLGT